LDRASLPLSVYFTGLEQEKVERSFLEKLFSLHKDKTLQRDILNRRMALPSEIENVINPSFPASLDNYLPTDANIREKGDLPKAGRQP